MAFAIVEFWTRMQELRVVKGELGFWDYVGLTLVTAGSLVGISQIIEAIRGKRLLSDLELSELERWEAGIGGMFQLLLTIFGIRAARGRGWRIPSWEEVRTGAGSAWQRFNEWLRNPFRRTPAPEQPQIPDNQRPRSPGNGNGSSEEPGLTPRERYERMQAERARQARLKRLEEEMQKWEERYKDLSQSDREWIEEDPSGRRRQLAFDPDKKQYSVEEARAAVEAEQQGIGPLERDIDPSTGHSTGGDFRGPDGTIWDVKNAIEGPDRIIDTASPPRPGKPGENIIVDCSDLTAEQARILIEDVNKRLPPGSGKVIFVNVRKP